MSKIFSGILSTLAVSLTLGAAQFAAGSDLVGQAWQSTAAATTADATINRETKGSRGCGGERVENPDDFRLSRWPFRHLDFGSGTGCRSKEARNIPPPRQ